MTNTDRLGLTPVEEKFLRRSADLDVTRRRVRTVLISASLFALLLVAAAVLTKSLPLIVGVALLYIVITTWERVVYGSAVLVYKRLVQKLQRGLEQRGTRDE